MFAWGGADQLGDSGGALWALWALWEALAAFQFAIAAAVALTTAVAQVRHARSGVPTARRDLLRLARAAGDSTWVSDGEHLVLTVAADGRAPLQVWTVGRMDQDQFRDAEPTGRVALTGEFFKILPVWPGVARTVSGVVGVRVRDGTFRDQTPAADFTWGDLLRLLYGTATARGAGVAEITELAAQFRKAAPLRSQAGAPGH